MMPPTRRLAGLYAALFLAAVLQATYADALHIRGARPDFLTLTIVLGALFCDANEAAGVGFFGGLLLACLAAPPGGGFGSLIVSRTLLGFGVGWLEKRVERDNPLIAVVLVAIGTLLAGGLFFLFAPQHAILHWARSLVLTTLYNAVLTFPLYLLIRRVAGEHQENHR